MHRIRRAIQAIFVLTLAALLAGGVLFVVGQAVALAAGQGGLLDFFDDAVKPALCIAASACAVAGFLLSYKSRQQQDVKEEAGTR